MNPSQLAMCKSHKQNLNYSILRRQEFEQSYNTGKTYDLSSSLLEVPRHMCFLQHVQISKFGPILIILQSFLFLVSRIKRPGDVQTHLLIYGSLCGLFALSLRLSLKKIKKINTTLFQGGLHTCLCFKFVFVEDDNKNAADGGGMQLGLHSFDVTKWEFEAIIMSFGGGSVNYFSLAGGQDNKWLNFPVVVGNANNECICQFYVVRLFMGNGHGSMLT